jgi:transposase InsO family protein
MKNFSCPNSLAFYTVKSVYRWQKELWSGAADIFRGENRRLKRMHEKEVSRLQERIRQKEKTVGELLEEYLKLKKKEWGNLSRIWVEPDTRDDVVYELEKWKEKTGRSKKEMTRIIGISQSKLSEWKRRYGVENRHNGKLPRYYWLEDWEKAEIVRYYLSHPGEGYRRVTYMMMDEDIVAVSPSTVYRVLKEAGVMRKWGRNGGKGGKGYIQPGGAHEEWHTDISYVKINGVYYYFCGVLDGYSRYMVYWELMENMSEKDVCLVQQRAIEEFKKANPEKERMPRLITDNGGQFVSKGFKEFLSHSGLQHTRTAPNHPQSNGKIERFHKTLRNECLRKNFPSSKKEAEKDMKEFVEYYNNVRLHSAIDYITPRDKLLGNAEKILAERDKKLEQARKRRRAKYLMLKAA